MRVGFLIAGILLAFSMESAVAQVETDPRKLADLQGQLLRAKAIARIERSGDEASPAAQSLRKKLKSNPTTLINVRYFYDDRERDKNFKLLLEKIDKNRKDPTNEYTQFAAFCKETLKIDLGGGSPSTATDAAPGTPTAMSPAPSATPASTSISRIDAPATTPMVVAASSTPKPSSTPATPAPTVAPSTPTPEPTPTPATPQPTASPKPTAAPTAVPATPAPTKAPSTPVAEKAAPPESTPASATQVPAKKGSPVLWIIVILLVLLLGWLGYQYLRLSVQVDELQNKCPEAILQDLQALHDQLPIESDAAGGLRLVAAYCSQYQGTLPDPEQGASLLQEAAGTFSGLVAQQGQLEEYAETALKNGAQWKKDAEEWQNRLRVLSGEFRRAKALVHGMGLQDARLESYFGEVAAACEDGNPSRIVAWIEENAQWFHENESIRHQAASISTAFHAERETHSADRAEATRQIEAAAHAVAEAQNRAHELESQMRTLQQDLDEHREAVAAALQVADGIIPGAANYGGAAALRSSIESLSIRVSEQTSLRHGAEAERDARAREVAQLQTRVRELESTAGASDELRNIRARAEELLGQLEAQRSDFNRLNAELSAVHREKEQLAAISAAQHAELERIRNQGGHQ